MQEGKESRDGSGIQGREGEGGRETKEGEEGQLWYEMGEPRDSERERRRERDEWRAGRGQKKSGGKRWRAVRETKK